MSTTANTIITGALQLLGVIDPEDTPSPSMAIGGLRRLNMMIGQLSLQSFTKPVTAREVFPLTAGRGGPDDPYTIGPGGDFDTSRPTEITGVGLNLNSSTPPVEIPRTILTDDAYEAIGIKDLANSLFVALYYSATFASGWGSINLWPVPSTALNDIVLYRQVSLLRFTSLTASYELPEGLDEVLEYNLCPRLAPLYTVPVPPEVATIAKNSLRIYKRSNVAMSDLIADGITRLRDGYNIDTGTGG